MDYARFLQDRNNQQRQRAKEAYQKKRPQSYPQADPGAVPAAEPSAASHLALGPDHESVAAIGGNPWVAEGDLRDDSTAESFFSGCTQISNEPHPKLFNTYVWLNGVKRIVIMDGGSQVKGISHPMLGQNSSKADNLPALIGVETQ